jgi:hypothetical protein
MRNLKSWPLRHPVFLTALVLFGFVQTAQAQDASVAETDAGWAFKLTPSFYSTQHESNAVDVNLRGNLDNHTTWIGQYVRGNEYQQTRWGYEYAANFDWGQMVPSLQLATKGFAGASVNFQIGGPTYLITGLGRTNLKDYYNLTFDPNDSYVIGLGTKLIKNHTLNVFTVKDNRLNTGQTVTHANWRWQITRTQRLVMDLSHKTGNLTADAVPLKGNAISISYDQGPHFIKWAKEQKVNFSDHDQQRISAGIRF